jgi:hypothetical protein
MRIHIISAALLAFALSCATMGQNSAQLKQAPQGPATTIPLSTGTPINASLVGTLDSAEQTRRSVTAMVTESVVYQRSVPPPRGSRILGRVVRTGADGEETRRCLSSLIESF